MIPNQHKSESANLRIELKDCLSEVSSKKSEMTPVNERKNSDIMSSNDKK